MRGFEQFLHWLTPNPSQHNATKQHKIFQLNMYISNNIPQMFHLGVFWKHRCFHAVSRGHWVQHTFHKRAGQWAVKLTVQQQPHGNKCSYVYIFFLFFSFALCLINIHLLTHLLLVSLVALTKLAKRYPFPQFCSVLIIELRY